MTSYRDALKLILEHAKMLTLESELVALEDVVGRTLFQRIESPSILPAFDTSAMDGYAVRSDETFDASEERPITFRVLGSLAAGDVASSASVVTSVGVVPSAGADSSDREFGAWEIMTGAPFPDGYDSCVRMEDVVRVGGSIVITKPVAPSHNRRKAAEDFRVGQIVLERGHVVRAMDLLCLAGLGITELQVTRKVRVAIIATGKELVDARETPHGAQVRNSTTPFLLQALKARGADIVSVASTGDDPSDFLLALDRARAADLILTTGAISVGKFDYVVKALVVRGLATYFQKLKIRPGKPLLFGRLADGRFVMGLPGNPVASATGFRFFVDPLLRALQGRTLEKPLLFPLATATRKALGATCFLKGVVSDGSVVAHENQKASMTSPLLSSNAWIVFDDEIPEHVDAGTMVNVYPFD